LWRPIRFIHTITTGEWWGRPTVEDALYAVEIIEAMAESARTGRWVRHDL
jgi:predicted dehydrogenase